LTRLVDCLEKLCRAQHHFSELEAKAWEWVGDKSNLPAFVELTYEPQQRKFVLSFTDTPEVPSDWALIAADAINNFRCALDYIAWQLVDIGTEPKPLSDSKARGVNFPVIAEWKPTETPGQAFRRACDRHLPGVDPTFLGIIEHYQPYKWGVAQVDNHPLARLVSFSNRDKHREVRLVATVPSGADYEVVGETNCVVKHIEPIRPSQFQPHAQFLWIYIDPTGEGDPDVNVKVATKALVSFVDGPPMETTMREIAAGVKAVVDEFRPLL
jgi:hypothetical protein